MHTGRTNIIYLVKETILVLPVFISQLTELRTAMISGIWRFAVQIIKYLVIAKNLMLCQNVVSREAYNLIIS